MNRRGFSLLEVLLAIAILGCSLLVVSQFLQMGARSAIESRELTTAQLMCESKMAEFTSGVAIPEAGEFPYSELPDEIDWYYNVELLPTSQTSLLELRLTVLKQRPQGLKPIQFTLVRWIQDPSLAIVDPFEELQAANEAAAAGTTTGGSTTSSTSGATTPMSTTGGANATR
jgi:prepilin-type N-terminal cleavage/methylation domain-containing protein